MNKLLRLILAALVLDCSPLIAQSQTTAGADTSDPATCVAGSRFANTTSGVHKLCTTANVWTTIGPFGLTGDVTTTSGTATATIANGAVTLAKMANMNTAKILGRATAGSGVPEEIAVTGTGSVVLANSPTLATPTIGAATGTSLAVTGALTSSGTAGIGYAAGAGGTVTQITSKATGVTLNKTVGTITMHNAALANQVTVTFVLTNSTIAATDFVDVRHSTIGTLGAYNFAASPSTGSVSISVRNVATSSLSEAIVIRFIVLKGATS